MAGAGAVLGAGALDLRAPAVALAAGDEPRLTGWTDAGTLVERGQYWPRSLERDKEQVLWTTLMKVDDKALVGSALDRWYLWFWTHDAPTARLYVGPAPEGPFRPWNQASGDGTGFCSFASFDSTTNSFCRTSQVTPPAAKVYDHNRGTFPEADRWHFSSGDIVWDPVTGHFYASPHIMRCGGAWQTTVIIRSSDGITWEYVAADPRVPIVGVGSASTAFDSYAVDYGRFLRDYGGNAVRHNGNLVWFYRGTRRDPTLGETYGLGCAISPDWTSWEKYPESVRNGKPLADLTSGREFQPGSALWVNGRAHLVHALSTVTMYLKTAAQSSDPFAWTSGPGTPIYQPSGPFIDGGSYVIHQGRHYFSYRRVVGIHNTDSARMRVELAVSLL